MAKRISKKRKTKTQLVKELDKVFSQYIRLSHADNNGQVKCVTCDRKGYWKGDSMQNGHFQSRRHMNTRWEYLNCAPQCYGCNVGKQGEQYKFAKYLDATYGDGTAESMEKQSKILVKFSPSELEEFITHYKEEVKKIANEKKIVL